MWQLCIGRCAPGGSAQVGAAGEGAQVAAAAAQLSVLLILNVSVQTITHREAARRSARLGR